MIIIENYLQELQKPDILYHAASHLTKTLIPRKSKIGHVPKNVEMKQNYNTKEWEKNAIFAATKPNQAIPFGLERPNMMWPNLHTREEVESWKYSCYLSVDDLTNILQVNYYNYTPKNPLYLYTLDSKDFSLIKDSKKAAVEQWYSMKEIYPLSVKKLLPNQVKESWKRISKEEWEKKKQKYLDKGYYKQ